MWGDLSRLGETDGALAATWTRRRYFVEGEFIRPIEGAGCEPYNPFEAYRGTDAASRGRSLYLALVELDTSSERNIEDFTSEWGLLGLFQHDLVQVRRVSWLGDDEPSSFPLIENPEWTPENLCELYERPGNPWLPEYRIRYITGEDYGSTYFDQMDWFGILPLEPDIEEVLVSHGYLARDERGELSLIDHQGAVRFLDAYLPPRNRARYRKWIKSQRFPYGSAWVETQEGRFEERSFQSYFGQYFPGLLGENVTSVTTGPEAGLPDSPTAPPTCDEVPPPTNYPRLDSPQLWDHLCEPLVAFRQAAQVFRQQYELCAYVSDHPDPLPQPRGYGEDFEVFRVDREKRDLLRWNFIQQLRRVHPMPGDHRSGSSWEWHWAFPSLLSALYVMMFLDFAVAKRRLCFCKSASCGKSFVADRPQHRYCSERCQNAQKQREKRGRDKQKITSAKEGVQNAG